METKELKIEVPKGYEIDKEQSSFEKIVFKKKVTTRWRDNEQNFVSGVWIDYRGELVNCNSATHRNIKENSNVFATEKQAKSSLAMAQISQIMANDERFGGVITDEEWGDGRPNKYIIIRNGNRIDRCIKHHIYHFLAFHTEEQRDLFLEENEDLVKEYLMID